MHEIEVPLNNSNSLINMQIAINKGVQEVRFITNGLLSQSIKLDSKLSKKYYAIFSIIIDLENAKDYFGEIQKKTWEGNNDFLAQAFISSAFSPF